MRTNTIAGSALAALALALTNTPAAAQAVAYKVHCHDVGFAAPEPLGDREGHAISVAQYTCRHEGGPWDGGTATGTIASEWDGTNAKVLSGTGVIRKPGAGCVYDHSSGKAALTLDKDGKVTGFTSSGGGACRLATGTAAAYAGKPYTYNCAATGPGRFSCDVKVE